MSELTPVPPRERLLTLDVLRGFALCGVLMGNMVLLSGEWAGLDASSNRLDEIADWFLQLAVRSKAQTLLTLLFGFGFAAQLLRAEERGEQVGRFYLRRMLALLGLGAAHVTLLWWGDVTWTYAISGFGMLAFVRASNRARVFWGLVFIFGPVLIVRSDPEIGRAAMRVFLEPQEFRAGTARMAAALQSDDRLALTWEHPRYLLVWCTRLWAWYFLWTLGRFLLGYVAGSRRWFDRDGADHLPVFRRLALWGGAVAVVTTTFDVLDRVNRLDLTTYGIGGRIAATAVHEIGLLAQTFFYVGVVVLLLQRSTWRRVLGVLAPAGRMPLTIYFSQSLIATFLFYGFGLGLAGEVGTAGQLGLAVAIFAVQAVLAHLWLRRYRFGPVEWLWRAAIYRHVPPMRLR